MPPQSQDPAQSYRCGISQAPNHPSQSEWLPTHQGVRHTKQHSFLSAFGEPLVSGDFLRQPYEHLHGAKHNPDAACALPSSVQTSDRAATQTYPHQCSSQAQLQQPHTPVAVDDSIPDNFQWMVREHSSPASFLPPNPPTSPDADLLQGLCMLSPIQDGRDACSQMYTNAVYASTKTRHNSLQDIPDIPDIFGTDTTQYSRSSGSGYKLAPSYSAHVDLDPPHADDMRVTPRLGGSCIPSRASYPTLPSSVNSIVPLEHAVSETMPCTPPASDGPPQAVHAHRAPSSRKRASSDVVHTSSHHDSALMCMLHQTVSDGRSWRLDYPSSTDGTPAMANLGRMSTSSDPSFQYPPHTPAQSLDTGHGGISNSLADSGRAAARYGLNTVPNSLAGSECQSEGSSLVSQGAAAAYLPPMTAEAPVEVLPSCPVPKMVPKQRSPPATTVPPLALPRIQQRRRSVGSGNPATDQVHRVRVKGRHSADSSFSLQQGVMLHAGQCAKPHEGASGLWQLNAAEQPGALDVESMKMLKPPPSTSQTPRSPRRQRQCRRAQTPRVNTAVPLLRPNVAAHGYQQQPGVHQEAKSILPSAPGCTNDSLYQGHGMCARTLMQTGVVPYSSGGISDNHPRGNLYAGRGDIYSKTRRKSKWQLNAMDEFKRELRSRLAVQGVEESSPISTAVGSPGIGSPAMGRSPYSPSQAWQQAQGMRERNFGDKIRLEESTLRDLAACMQKKMR